MNAASATHVVTLTPGRDSMLDLELLFVTTLNAADGTAYPRLVLDAAPTRVKLDVNDAPRFNESEGHGPKRAHKVSDYFDDLSQHLIWEIYKKDFQLFKYDFDDPDNKFPKAEVDLEEVHAKLGR